MFAKRLQRMTREISQGKAVVAHDLTILQRLTTPLKHQPTSASQHQHVTIYQLNYTLCSPLSTGICYFIQTSFRILWSVEKITEPSARTIRLDATPSRPTIPPPPSSPPNFTPDAFPVAMLPIYPGLGQPANMLDCIPEIYNPLKHWQNTEPPPQVMCIENLVKFRNVVAKICMLVYVMRFTQQLKEKRKDFQRY